MILFEYIKYKNFLSAGDAAIEIDFQKSYTALVIGENGNGKSSMLDALCFALYGKAYRNINKPLLINSVNNKHCVVEIGFSIGRNQYRVIRGMKPTIFEIYHNGILINQDAHNRDYQEVLEQQILKLNYRTFIQTVIVGSASSVPFMQLPTGQRREIIEDLLDIRIFSSMNQILKDKISAFKRELSDLNNELIRKNDAMKLLKAQRDRLTELSRSLNADKNQRIADLEKQMGENIAKKIQAEDILSRFSDTITKNHRSVTETLAARLSEQQALNRELSALAKETKFYDQNSSCPTCKQSISEVLRTEKIRLGKEQASDIIGKSEIIEISIKEMQITVSKVNEEIEKIGNLRNRIKTNVMLIESLTKQIDSIRAEKTQNVSDDEIRQVEINLEETRAEFEKISLNISAINDEMRYYDLIGEYLKDTGIKTQIVKQYIPVINRLINQYLHTFDFFVSFHLDESFCEVIKSRHRDNFTYSSFSEGEKARIDLSLLFTWRQVSRMKNSASTNLLILDEIFDSSLDAVGTDALLNILSTLDTGTRCFVISHKHEALLGKFERTLRFTKSGNFSSIEETS